MQYTRGSWNPAKTNLILLGSVALTHVYLHPHARAHLQKTRIPYLFNLDLKYTIKIVEICILPTTRVAYGQIYVLTRKGRD